MVEHQLGAVTELGQVVEQHALLVRRLVQFDVMRLATAGAQHADRCRAAVRGGRVEAVEHHVHAPEQGVVAHAGIFQVVPGQRAHVEHQQVERFGRGITLRKTGHLARLLAVELLQPGIDGLAFGQRATGALGGARLAGDRLHRGTDCRQSTGEVHPQQQRDTDQCQAHPRGNEQIGQADGEKHAEHIPVDEAPKQIDDVVDGERQHLGLLEQPAKRRVPGVLVEQRGSQRHRNDVAQAR
ncbi:hypothetical protein D3C76_833760 [compost metagenome]